LDHYAALVEREDVEKGTNDPLEARRLCADGKVDAWHDKVRDSKLGVWEALF